MRSFSKAILIVGEEKINDFNFSLKESFILRSPLGLIEISPFDFKNLMSSLDCLLIF